MRRFALAAFAACFALPATPQDPFLSGDQLAAEVKKECEDGCMVFSKAQMADLVQQVNQMVQEREAAAFRKGALSCRNAI